MIEDELAEKLFQLLISRAATRILDPAAFATAPAPGTASDSHEHSDANRQLIRDRITRSGVFEWTPATSTTTPSATAETDGQSS